MRAGADDHTRTPPVEDFNDDPGSRDTFPPGDSFDRKIPPSLGAARRRPILETPDVPSRWSSRDRFVSFDAIPPSISASN